MLREKTFQIIEQISIWHLLAFALLVRLVLVLITDPYGNDTVDGQDYHNHAISVLNGEGYPNRGSLPFMRPPLYPFLLAGVYAVFPHDSFLTARLVNALLDLGACYVFYKLIELVWENRRIAIISSVIYAVNPFFLFFVVRVRVEALFTLLVAIGVFSIVKLYKGHGNQHFRWALLSGFCFGLSALCRSNATPFLVLVPIFLFCIFNSNLKKAAQIALLFVAAGMTAVIPWSVRNYYSFGEPVLITDGFGYAFWISNTELKFDDLYARNYEEYLQADRKLWLSFAEVERQVEGLSTMERDRYYRSLTYDYISSNFMRWLWLNVLKSVEFWSPMARIDMQGFRSLLTFPFGLMTLIGLVGYGLCVWRKSLDARFLWLLFILIFVSMGTGVLTWSSLRFRVPLIDPYLIPFGLSILLRRAVSI